MQIIKSDVILLVDDEEMTLKATAKVISNAGYNLKTAKSISEALDVLETLRPDIILLDVFLHNESGFDLLETLKENERYKSIFVVMITGQKVTSEDQAKGLELGADGYLNRQIDSRELVARIEAFLRHKRTIDELNKANLALNKFFSIIAHDLKGPLTGLLHLTEMMANEKENFTTFEFIESSKLLNKSANNIYQLLSNLLEWARIKKGAIHYSPQVFDLSSIISSTISILEQRATQKGIKLINQNESLLEVYADINMSRTILRNLISNAIKFTKRGGVIVVNVLPSENNNLEVSISDNGIGMSREWINKLFVLGENVGTKGTDGELSTGLGLILCKEFLELNKGRIWAESKIGKGSIFYFTIPRKS